MSLKASTSSFNFHEIAEKKNSREKLSNVCKLKERSHVFNLFIS